MRALALGLCWFVMSCVQTESVTCEFATCPATTVCDETHAQCVAPDQLTSCGDAADGTDCRVSVDGDGTCDRGVCLTKRCGDGYRRGGEECDGTDLGERATCVQHGYYDPVEVSCNADCSYNTSACATAGSCGDSIVQTPIEYCEPPTDPVKTCSELGFDAGDLRCTAACGPEISGCKRYGWGIRELTSGTINAMAALSESDVWFVGAGFALHSDGTTTQSIDLTSCLPNTSLTAVWALGPAQAVIAGNAGVATISNGTCQVLSTANEHALASDLWATGPTNIYLMAISGVFHYDGTSWTQLTIPGIGSTNLPAAIWGRGPDDIWLSKGAVVRHWDGTAWNVIPDPPLTEIRAITGTATDVFIGGRNNSTGVVLRYNNGTWTSTLLSFAGRVEAMTVQDGRVFAGGGTSTTVPKLFAYDGTTWTDLQAPADTSSILSLSPIGRGKLLASTGRIVRRYEGSVFLPSFRTTTLGTFAGLERVHVRIPNEIYAIGHDGSLTIFTVIYRWDGAQWADETFFDSLGPHDLIVDPTNRYAYVPTDDGIYYTQSIGSWQKLVPGMTTGRRLWAQSSTDLWIWSSTQELFHFTGASLDTCASCTNTGPIEAMWGSSSSDIYAVGGSTTGKILHWDGSSWTAATTPISVHWFAVWGSSATDVYAVGDGGAIVHWDGSTWHDESIPLPARLTGLTGTSASDVAAGGESGVMYHRDPADGVWSPMTSGTSDVRGMEVFGDTLYYVEDNYSVRRLARTQNW